MSVIFGKLLFLCTIIISLLFLIKARSKAKDDQQTRKALLIPIGLLSMLLVGYIIYSLEVFGLSPVVADHWDAPRDNKIPKSAPIVSDPPQDKPKTDKEETAQTIDEQKSRLEAFENE